MSADDLLHIIEEIEKKQNTDARAALNLLQIILKSKQSSQVLEKTQADKRVRKLLAVPIKMPYTSEKEDVKKRCRELIQRWGHQRMEEKRREE